MPPHKYGALRVINLAPATVPLFSAEGPQTSYGALAPAGPKGKLVGV